MESSTYVETLKEAVAHERAGRWAAASDAWRRAAHALAGRRQPVPEHLTRRGGARRGAAGLDLARRRFDAAGLRPGDELRHVRRGVVRATCVYRGADAFEYGGRTFANLTAVARAAAADLNRAVGNPAEFWGLSKKESPTFTRVDERDAA